MSAGSGRLAGKSAIITGAAQGLGLAIAKRFAAEGARLLLADIDEAKVRAAAAELGAEAIRTDVSSNIDIATLATAAINKLGVIDVLVNNAGVFHGATLFDLSEAEFDRVMAINVKSVLLATQAVAPHMRARGCGSIINMSSLGGVLAQPSALAYSVSKAAVCQLTNASALALAPYNVRVNAIGPSTFATDMAEAVYADADTKRSMLARTPMGRIGRPDEVAGVALFLASEDSSYVTGKTIYVDGGRMGLNITMPNMTMTERT